MSEQMFLALSIVIWAVVITLGIMKALKQPMIIWYILAGTLITIFLPTLLHGNEAFQSFGNLWISFLLFMVGMELNPKIIKELWKTALIAWLLQVAITSAVGVWIASLLWFDLITSLYLWVGFAFSSTIVVLKLLGDKDEMESTFGRLSIGILVVQDLIVMAVLLWLATFKNIGQMSWMVMVGWLIAKVIGICVFVYIANKYLIPKITKYIAESQEYLFLFAIARCFALGSAFHLLGFGIEIWTLIAGITLASSSYRYEITSKIKSLKDFFIVIFFVLLWSHVDFWAALKVLPQVIILTIFVLIVKPIITSLILGRMWHTDVYKRQIYYINIWSNEYDFDDIARKLWWSTYKITTEQELLKNKLFWDKVTYINLPEYKGKKVLMLVYINKNIRLIEVENQLYYKSKWYLKSLFID